MIKFLHWRVKKYRKKERKKWKLKLKFQIQSKLTSIDATKSNRRQLQELEDQAILLLQVRKSCKIKVYKKMKR